MIAVRGDKGSLELSTYLEEHAEILPANSRNLAGRGHIIKGLEENAIQFHSKDFEDYHDISDFIKRNDTPIRNDVISFYLNTKYEDLQKDLRDGVYKWFKSVSLSRKITRTGSVM